MIHHGSQPLFTLILVRSMTHIFMHLLRLWWWYWWCEIIAYSKNKLQPSCPKRLPFCRPLNFWVSVPTMKSLHLHGKMCTPATTCQTTKTWQIVFPLDIFPAMMLHQFSAGCNFMLVSGINFLISPSKSVYACFPNVSRLLKKKPWRLMRGKAAASCSGGPVFLFWQDCPFRNFIWDITSNWPAVC